MFVRSRASRSNLDAPIPLIARTAYTDYPTVRLHNTTPAAGDAPAVDHRVELPICPHMEDPEQLVRVIHEFLDACDSSLDIPVANRYVRLREVLGGEIRSNWDAIVDETPAAARTAANLPVKIRELTSSAFPSNAFFLQDELLRQAKKPYFMTCFALSARLKLINTLSVYLPGSNNIRLYPDALSLKRAYMRLMPDNWQNLFVTAGNRFERDDYPFQALVDFMDIQRRLGSDDTARPYIPSSARAPYLSSPSSGPRRHYADRPSPRYYLGGNSYGGRGNGGRGYGGRDNGGRRNGGRTFGGRSPAPGRGNPTAVTRSPYSLRSRGSPRSAGRSPGAPTRRNLGFQGYQHSSPYARPRQRSAHHDQYYSHDTDEHAPAPSSYAPPPEPAPDEFHYDAEHDPDYHDEYEHYEHDTWFQNY